MKPERIILGIDPGTNIMGYGLIKTMGKQMELVAMGIVKLDKLGNHALKLKKIFERTLFLINEYHPDELAIEAPFFGKNIQSMLKLGRAQGVAMAAALYKDIPIVEYSPKKIKQSITGNGSASKEQVAKMLAQLINIDDNPTYLDATDGLAAAVCHFLQNTPVSNEKSYTGWDNYIKNNPDKISGK